MEVATLFCIVAMVTHAFLGLLVFFKSPGNSINRTFAVLLGLFFLWSLCELIIMQRGYSLVLVKAMCTPVAILPYVFALFAALFPRRVENAPILAPGWKGPALAVPTLILLFWIWTDKLLTTVDPISSGLLVTFGRVEFLAKGIIAGYLLLALRTLSSAWAGLDSDFQQTRLRYFFGALVLPATGGSVYIALGRWYLVGFTSYTYGVFPCLGIIMAAMLAYAILRYKLLDIDLIFSIGLVYTLLTAILAGTMELFENAMQNLLNITGTWATVASTLMIAAVFSPLKDLIVKLVDRMFGKKEFDVAAVLGHMLRMMRQAVSPPEVLQKVLAESRQVMNFTSGLIVMRSGLKVGYPAAAEFLPPLPESWPPIEDLDALAASERDIGSPDAATFEAWKGMGFRLILPIHREKEIAGALFLGQKENRLPFSLQEKSLLAGLCQEIPPVFETLKLLEARVERDRARSEVEWAQQMCLKIQADPGLSRFGAYRVRLFSSLAREIKGDLIDCLGEGDAPFIAVCDAFHHGIQAALTLNLMYSAFRAAPRKTRLEAVHHVLGKFTTPPLRSAVTFLEPESGSLLVGSAGNPPPILFSPDSEPRPLMKQGKPLGMEGALPIGYFELRLRGGEFLLVSTNGLSKAFGDPDGKGLLEFLSQKAPGGMLGCHSAMMEYLGALPGKQEFPDDITYLFLELGE